MKDNIAMAGYCIVEEVRDVETTIDFNAKTITYHLLLPEDLYKNLMLLERFEKGDNIGFWDSRKLKKFLQQKKENDESGMGYRLEDIANKFIKAYLTKEWSANIKLFNMENEKEDTWLHNSGDQQVN
jgi:hypothetical protein